METIWKSRGWDVSHHQGRINWDVVAQEFSAGVIDFLYIRAAYGITEDREWQRNKSCARAAGIPFGAYQYFVPWEDPRAQARKFAWLVGEIDAGGRWHYAGSRKFPPALDVEEQGVRVLLTVDSWKYTALIEQWIDEFTAITGMTPAPLRTERSAFYTSAGFWNKWIRPHTKWSDHPLWIASWTSAASPTIPADWARAEKGPFLWQWQVRSDGKEHGMESYGLDENRCIYSRQELLAGTEAPAPAPPQEPAEPQPQQPGVVEVAVPVLNIRDRAEADTTSTKSVIGQTRQGVRWHVTGVAVDDRGRVWYRSGPTAHLAAWLCKVVE